MALKEFGNCGHCSLTACTLHRRRGATHGLQAAFVCGLVATPVDVSIAQATSQADAHRRTFNHFVCAWCSKVIQTHQHIGYVMQLSTFRVRYHNALTHKGCPVFRLLAWQQQHTEQRTCMIARAMMQLTTTWDRCSCGQGPWDPGSVTTLTLH